MPNSKKTVVLLDALVKLGFDDRAFWRLHHKREATPRRPRPERETVGAFRSYCEEGHEFRRDEENERVHRRLEFVIKVYSNVGFAGGEINVFIALAEAAFIAIPTRQSRG